MTVCQNIMTFGDATQTHDGEHSYRLTIHIRIFTTTECGQVQLMFTVNFVCFFFEFSHFAFDPYAIIALNNHFHFWSSICNLIAFNFVVSIACKAFAFLCYAFNRYHRFTMSLISNFFGEFVPFLLRNAQFDLVEWQNAAKQHTEKLKLNGDIGFPTSLKAWAHAIDVPLSRKIIDETDTERQSALIESSRQWSFPIKEIQCTENRCILFLDRTKCFENVLKNVLNEKQDFGRWKSPTMESGKTFAVSLVLHSNNDSLTEHRCTLVRNVLVNMLRVSGYRLTDDANQSTVNLIVTHPRSDNEKRQNGNETETPIEGKKIVCGIVKSEEKLTATDYIQ